LKLVIFGWGNESRGDDAFGPLLLRRAEALGLTDVTAVEDFQLQIEHALDLDDADLALFLDASRMAEPPFSFKEIFPRTDLGYTTHALAPEAVLSVFAQLRKREPPPSFALGVRGESYGLGEDLSPQGRERLEAAWKFTESLIKAPDAEAWRKHATL